MSIRRSSGDRRLPSTARRSTRASRAASATGSARSSSNERGCYHDERIGLSRAAVDRPGENAARPSATTLERFIARVESNAHVEAIEEFYTEDASMRENFSPPRVG